MDAYRVKKLIGRGAHGSAHLVEVRVMVQGAGRDERKAARLHLRMRGCVLACICCGRNGAHTGSELVLATLTIWPTRALSASRTPKPKRG